MKEISEEEILEAKIIGLLRGADASESFIEANKALVREMITIFKSHTINETLAWVREVIEGIELPEDHIACDYGDHLDKNDLLTLLETKDTN